MHFVNLGKNVSILDFNYDSFIGDLMFENVKQTYFKGMTGTVSFDEHGETISVTKMAQYKGNTCTHVLLFCSHCLQFD